ncbi:conserved hypothetical protein, secreted [Olavius algarvensis associated proteobacterium Delta 3]|nr:conserved hypothetical protein, secreted [Olavius algarvensis associated proteobacterium Delta 3]
MTKIARMMIAVLGILVLAAPAIAGWDANLDKKAQKAIREFKKVDPGMKAFFNKAYGYAVFPTVGKGAIGIGGAHGKGLVYRKGRVIGKTSLSQATIGFQLGGQAYREIIFFEDKRALDKFKKGNFAFSGQASAVAAASGASANVDYAGGVAVFTMAKGGLMFEASIGGQRFTFKPK